MTKHRMMNLILSVLMIASMLLGGSGAIAAPSSKPDGVTAGAPDQSPNLIPGSPTDESKVPHYYGPYSNYANSAFTLADVTVDISGDGSGATATASVGADGAITGVTITNPGSGYDPASTP